MTVEAAGRPVASKVTRPKHGPAGRYRPASDMLLHVHDDWTVSSAVASKSIEGDRRMTAKTQRGALTAKPSAVTENSSLTASTSQSQRNIISIDNKTNLFLQLLCFPLHKEFGITGSPVSSVIAAVRGL